MSSFANHEGRKNTTRGDWWPRKTKVGTTQKGYMRYGVIETSGYDNLQGPRCSTSYLVLDSAADGAVVKEFRVPGMPGGLRQQIARRAACRFAAQLNHEDRAFDRESA